MATHRPDLNFIFPNAPNAPVSLNMGMRMPSWFDIKASLAARVGPFRLVDKQFYRPKKIWSLEIYQKICCFFKFFYNFRSRNVN